MLWFPRNFENPKKIAKYTFLLNKFNNIFFTLGPTQACDIAYCSAPTNSIPVTVSQKTLNKIDLGFYETINPTVPTIISPTINLVSKENIYYLVGV